MFSLKKIPKGVIFSIGQPLTKKKKQLSSNFFNISIRPYAAIIIKICRAYTHTQEDFEDYYQEVCLQIWRSKDNFKEQSTWSTWIYRLTLNVCMTLQKKKKIPIAPLDKHDFQIAQTETSSSNTEDINHLYAAIRKLSDIDRAVILLYLEEKSYQEIADIIGTSPTNIGVRINRIKKRLKKILNEQIN